MPVLLVAAIIITTAIVSAAVVTAEELDYTTYCMIDFSSYTLKAVSSTVQSGNARSNAGAFSVESDSDAAGGKYLKYKRNSTITVAIRRRLIGLPMPRWIVSRSAIFLSSR